MDHSSGRVGRAHDIQLLGTDFKTVSISRNQTGCPWATWEPEEVGAAVAVASAVELEVVVVADAAFGIAAVGIQ